MKNAERDSDLADGAIGVASSGSVARLESVALKILVRWHRVSDRPHDSQIAYIVKKCFQGAHLRGARLVQNRANPVRESQANHRRLLRGAQTQESSRGGQTAQRRNTLERQAGSSVPFSLQGGKCQEEHQKSWQGVLQRTLQREKRTVGAENMNTQTEEYESSLLGSLPTCVVTFCIDLGLARARSVLCGSGTR